VKPRAEIADAVTVLRSRGGRLTKLVRPDGEIEGYDAALRFDLFSMPVGGLADLHGLLRRLLDRQDCAVVRGDIADATRTLAVRRLIHRDSGTGDEPTLIETPRRWLALDLDSVPRPEAVAAADLAACGAVAVRELPAEFRSASKIVQATATHGIKPGLRLRLWFWLDRPITGNEAKYWLRDAPVDSSVFGAAQIIYSAAPQFAPSAVDPIQQRLVWMPSVFPVVTVPPASDFAVQKTAPISRVIVADAHALAGLARKVARASEGQRNKIAFWAACRAGEMAASGLIGKRTAAAVIAEAAVASGLSRQEAESTASNGVRLGSGASGYD
jgi:hypothetical protein